MTDKTGKELEVYNAKLIELLETYDPGDIARMMHGQLTPPTSALRAAIRRFVWRINTGALDAKTGATEAEIRYMRTLREHSLVYDELLDVSVEIDQNRQDRQAKRKIRDAERAAEIVRAEKERSAKHEAAKRHEFFAKAKAMSAEMVHLRMQELLAARKECQQQFITAKTEEERKKIQLRTLTLDRDLQNVQRDLALIQGKHQSDQAPAGVLAPAAPDYVGRLIAWLDDIGENPKDEHHTFMRVHNELRIRHRRSQNPLRSPDDWIAFARELNRSGDYPDWINDDALATYTAVMGQLNQSGYGDG